MKTGGCSMTVQLERSTVPNDQHRKLRRWWSVITGLLVLVVFLEAVFAGAMLSGVDWARTAHRASAVMLIISTAAAGLVSIPTLRRIPGGLKLGLTLLSLAALVFLQAAVGALSAKGANLLWIHIPLGVSLFGLATQAARGARRLREAHDV
jgi:hypothetical protein